MKLALQSTPGSGSVTRLSWRGSSALGFGAIFALAWRSLLGLSTMLVLPSCIVAEPPEFTDAVRTGVFLDSQSAVPRTDNVLVVFKNDMLGVPITVPVRSEDAGEDLYVRFFLDYGVPSVEVRLGGYPLPPSSYDDTKRAASLQFVPRSSTSKGCHLLTLIVAHKSSFKLTGDDSYLDPMTSSSDAAILHWRVNVDPDIDNLNTLINCPVSTQPGL